MKSTGLLSRQKSSNSGFTLIEVMVAMAIFAIGILAVSALMVASVESTNKSRRTTDGVTLAVDRLEQLITVDYSDANLQDADGDGTGGLIDVGFDNDPGTTGDSDFADVQPGYTVHWNVAPFDIDNDGQLDDSGNGIPDGKAITVIVTWNYGRMRQVRIEHVLSELPTL